MLADGFRAKGNRLNPKEVKNNKPESHDHEFELCVRGGAHAEVHVVLHRGHPAAQAQAAEGGHPVALLQ